MKYKYKVCVYAICKNEEKNIDRWYRSVSEADEIYVLDTGSGDNSVNVLDTGSTDNTMKLLEGKDKVVVKQQVITPWRFDVARNKSLEMVPGDADICVCVDLDEIYRPGWREKMEMVWKKDTNRLKHTYNWKIVDSKPVISFYYEKIHSRHNYKWVHPVHEVLETSLSNEKVVVAGCYFRSLSR